ncbi:protein FAR1-RELATED SEQUENCE 5-like [Arachis ipaensis]|uniref:protein FAR1-RELATED SEQUENCE 5-like n=1 Tax=Arachis ipaensis TaxID=130454 RepID=UPI0007AF80FD|nr:protein FAR1-RELATED SEQUENCE 5-like [Arachis ipaensis]XP_025661709.1 protein FAR1-RELATED SEQUENCE 5-like [Arachis hypogaea]
MTEIRNTNFDKTRKESRIPINQSIHCNREGYWESQVKAASRVKKITTTRYRARMYVMFDRQKDIWMVSKLELKHSHPCSTKQPVHYYEYRELTMHAKYVIEDNDEAGIWPNKTYFALENEVGGLSNLGYSEKDVRNYITSNLCLDVDAANKFRSVLWIDARCRASYDYYEDVILFDTTYSRNKYGLPFASLVGVNHNGKSIMLGCALLGNEKIRSFKPSSQTSVSPCDAINNVLLNTLHRRCIWHILKKIPHELEGYTRYREINAKMTTTIWNVQFVESFEKDWAGFIPKFNQEHNRWLSDRVPSCYVLPRGSKNVRCKYTYIKSNHDENRSDERHNLVRGLCSRFFNVAQDFVTCDEEANTLHSGLDELFDYHSNLGSKSVAPTQNSMVTQYEFALGADNIRGPSKVATKGRPRSKRLGSKLDSSTKKSMRRKKKNAPPKMM